jgi:hypothetical protein
MTARTTTSPAKKLQGIRKKIETLQQEETKICRNLAQELSRHLIAAHALEIDFDILIGGVLGVITESKADTVKAMSWQKSGQEFLRNQNRREREKA